MTTRVLACGGRDYADAEVVFAALDSLRASRGEIVIINGGANGADGLSARWSISRGQGLVAVPAEWKTYGRSAGPLRNRTMLADHKPDLVVAFPGGRGTRDMIRQAEAFGVEVLRIEKTTST